MSFMREPNAEPIPGYRLLEPLGSGGFGEVWKCEAPGGIHKAMKFVYGNLNSLDLDANRAEQELNALQRIKEVRHPFVCSLDRIEIVEGELVIVMELAEKTLHDLFVENQAAGMIGIPRDALLRYLRDAAEALDHMNEKHKLQHLDVKPRNLFLISDRVKVADFGLVKHLERLSASGLLGGVTPLYAPPETFNGKISERSDQYSLAIVYQELLTGHRPFTGKNVRQLAQQHLQGEPDLRSLPEAERPIVARALAKDPSKRFANCMALIRALYTARAPVRAAASTAGASELAASGVGGNRPKTMADTMEDMLLDPAAGALADELNLALPPRATGTPRQRAAGDQEEGAAAGDEQHLLEVSQLGLTIAQPDSGALRPTIFIGLGGFGRKALLELRCRFLDRFGDLTKIPLLRFLCVDPDPEAVNMAVRGAPEVALARSEVYHLPLQPVGNYRRRSLDLLAEWLPREKLYAMPRSLQPQGSRALGRLAFVDNQQRLVARLRKEIQEAVNPDVIYQSVTATGLALRDNVPRIYILASAAGGSSGALLDLGYALRRQLALLRYPDATVTLFLLSGAPNDPASPRSELANIYATLTEINHYSDPTIGFAAQYGTEGQRLVEQGPPFGSVYLLPLAHRGPEAMEEVVAHLGSYLFHEVTTPLGLRLELDRRGDVHSSPQNMLDLPFRSLGTYAVWFPRGLLLRLASRLASRRLIESWLATPDTGLPVPPPPEVRAVCERVAADPQLTPDLILPRLGEASRSASTADLGNSPAEALTGQLAHLEEQSHQQVATSDPGNWARQALNRIKDWIGSGEAGHEIAEWRKNRVNRALHAAAQKVAQETEQQLVGPLFTVMETPGERVAAAEYAVHHLQQFCAQAAEAQNKVLQQQKARCEQAWAQLESALADCLAGTGGFRLFGGRSNRRLLAGFMDSLSLYVRQRLQEENIAALQQFYIAFQGRLADRLRDLGFCRQRLRHLQENLEFLPSYEEDTTATRPGNELTVSRSPLPGTDAYWEAIRQTRTARVVLPENEEDLERSALKLLQRLTPENWQQLDKDLHERVLLPRGGLYQAVMNHGDLTRMLAAPLMEETITLLGEHLPVMDVADILAAEFGLPPARCAGSIKEQGPGTKEEGLFGPLDLVPGTSAGGGPELEAHTRAYLERAAALISRTDGKGRQTYLLVPASPAGKAFGQAIAAALPELKQVKVAGQSDLMFCCDQGSLTQNDLQKLFKPCRQAYDATVNTPQTSAHARFDLTDWLPLDP